MLERNDLFFDKITWTSWPFYRTGNEDCIIASTVEDLSCTESGNDESFETRTIWALLLRGHRPGSAPQTSDIFDLAIDFMPSDWLCEKTGRIFTITVQYVICVVRDKMAAAEPSVPFTVDANSSHERYPQKKADKKWWISHFFLSLQFYPRNQNRQSRLHNLLYQPFKKNNNKINNITTGTLGFTKALKNFLFRISMTLSVLCCATADALLRCAASRAYADLRNGRHLEKEGGEKKAFVHKKTNATVTILVPQQNITVSKNKQ